MVIKHSNRYDDFDYSYSLRLSGMLHNWGDGGFLSMSRWFGEFEILFIFVVVDSLSFVWGSYIVWEMKFISFLCLDL